MFRVIGSDTYLEEISEWSKIDREAVDKLPNKLAENPYVGKQLSYSFIREKKIREKRVYYLIYEDLKLVMLVATSSKKDQQKTIDRIKDNLDEFKKVAVEISKQAP